MVDGCWVGTGVALGTFPRVSFPGIAARVTALAGGRYRVELGAVDIGTGAWTILRQVAADALEVDLADVDMEIGSSALPFGAVAGGSAGTGMWSDAVDGACHSFRDQFGLAPPEGAQVTGDAGTPFESPYSRHAWAAQFAEVRVDADTGEARVTRLLGAYDVGRIINPRTARSQLVGGMTMALSAALFEDGVMDPRFGHVITHDLASYHVAAHADVIDVDAIWLGTPDPHFNRLGTKGLGEVGATGVAAAIANAAWHATGIRVRSLPMTPEHFLG
jgi:xanthine dehydrogenase YagR molybdenum-binding subunit